MAAPLWGDRRSPRQALPACWSALARLLGLSSHVEPRLWLCAGQGYDTRALQAYPGHRNIQHTVRYTEPSPGRFKEGQRAPPADLFPRLPTTAAGRGKIRFRQHIGIHRHIRGSARPATSAPILTYLRRARWLASGRRITLAE
jgi:hypothetical protein